MQNTLRSLSLFFLNAQFLLPSSGVVTVQTLRLKTWLKSLQKMNSDGCNPRALWTLSYYIHARPSSSRWGINTQQPQFALPLAQVLHRRWEGLSGSNQSMVPRGSERAQVWLPGDLGNFLQLFWPQFSQQLKEGFMLRPLLGLTPS